MPAAHHSPHSRHRDHRTTRVAPRKVAHAGCINRRPTAPPPTPPASSAPSPPDTDTDPTAVDSGLIKQFREGTVSAYGSLYQRHVSSAYNLARQLTRRGR